MPKVFHWLFRLFEIAVVALVTIIVGRAFQARTLPDRKRGVAPSWDEPAGLKGGVLLVHGLSDGPYSVRPLARNEADGRYAKALDSSGHSSAVDWRQTAPTISTSAL